MDTLLQAALDAKLFYGAEVLLAQGANVQLHRTYGTYDGTRPLEKTAVFDVASLTKPVATASLLLTLGLNLDSLVSAYLPGFTGGNKEAVTLRHLAAHLSGLPPTVRFIETCTTPNETFEALLKVPLQSPPGSTVTYSCLGYMLLGKVLEAHTGQSLQSLFANHIATPAGMANSGFLPKTTLARLVPSGMRPHNGGQLGVVNDSNAWLMGGASGNAGLFSTAPDLHRFAQWILRTPMPEMFANQSPTGAVARTIGFELHTSAVSHTGFTGTSLWINPKTARIAILLSNRTAISHRGSLEAMKTFRQQFYSALARNQP
ncbi:MAG: beta-lactamase family protein [Rhodobacteraceae bacterium]|nr:beta-lactamase family protein [Paracoccaceae bacterium]